MRRLLVALVAAVQVRITGGGYGSISNISLILVAGAPVP